MQSQIWLQILFVPGNKSFVTAICGRKILFYLLVYEEKGGRERSLKVLVAVHVWTELSALYNILLLFVWYVVCVPRYELLWC